MQILEGINRHKSDWILVKKQTIYQMGPMVGGFLETSASFMASKMQGTLWDPRPEPCELHKIPVCPTWLGFMRLQ